MSETEDLREELERLRRQLAQREREADEQRRALARYAEELRAASEREQARARELRASYEATVRALADAVEARDPSTARHAERVAAYGLEIARTFGIPAADAAEMEFGFLLHDVGKVAISDAILHKPGRLTPAERADMRRHPVIGEEIVRGIDFLGEAREVVRSHHERWDGAGYPDRLAGEEIPLSARVFAVADTFDALTSDRPYRRATSFRVARQVIAAAAGSQFDPRIAEAFDNIADSTLNGIRAALA